MANRFYTLQAGGHEVSFLERLTPKACMEVVKSFQFKPDDVVVSSYPKTGSFWMSEMVWQIMHPDETPSEQLLLRVPALENASFPYSGTSSMQLLKEKQSLRVMKTLLIPEFFCDDWLESGAKFILLIRNPKDMLVSFFHQYKSLEMLGFSGSWDEFFVMFKEEKLVKGDYFHFYESWWRFHNHPNVMFISYEELKEDHQKGVHRLGDFLRGGISDEIARRIVEATSVEAMREDKKFNEAVGTLATHGASQFVRKGIVGDWKNYFTPEQNEYVEKLYREKLEPLGLKVKFEI